MRTRLGSVGLVAMASACGRGPQAPHSLPGAATAQATAQEYHEDTRTASPADAGAQGSTYGVTSDEAFALALKWFEAARVRDAEGVIGAMAIPSAIRGFTLTNGPQADACGTTPDTNGLGLMGIEREIRDTSELADTVRCLLLDDFLLNNIPVRRNSNWPPDPVFPAPGGSIGLIVVDDLVERLSRWKTRCESVAETHFLVQARMTDGNGITNHVVLTVPQVYPPRVDGVLIDELFEH